MTMLNDLLRPNRRASQLLLVAALTSVISVAAPSQAQDPVAAPSEETLVFERDIRPILRAHCLDCHGATSEKEAGLDLRQVRLMLSGGDSGPAIDLEHASQSLLLERINSNEMPPGSIKVTAEEKERLARWIAAGAPTARPETDMPSDGIGITPEDRQWWAFQPLVPPAIPAVDDPRIRNPIDRFVLAKLAEQGLNLSPEADRRALAIRVWIDLTGLPPTDSELRSYLADEAPLAYERLIDRLLETPAYGERWARHWLDVAGYADSEGFTTNDVERPWAYHYRDYVIRAFRDDKPIDRFIQEQLAGDELFAGDLAEPDPALLDPLIATGFLRTAADGTGQGGDEPVARNQNIADTLKIVSSNLLGLTVACAQCHDHRYDPILQEDYYRLRSVFAPAIDADQWLAPSQRLVSLYTSVDRAKAAEVEAQAAAVAEERRVKEEAFMNEAFDKELLKYEEPLRTQLREAYRTPSGERSAEQTALLDANPSVNLSPGVLYQYNQAAADELKTYDQRIAEIRATKPLERFLSVVREPVGHLPVTKIFHRGDYRQPTTEVAPGDLTVLFQEEAREDLPSDDPNLPTSGRRLAFAKQLTSGQHPLFNRVFVNRIWMHHFGRGIVPTPGDFGRLGDPPSHPQLLDWLACELPDQNWSLKALHRLIMTSATYRQSSGSNSEYEALDAESRWLWRFPLKRLEAEAIRDRVLQVAGGLEATEFGPPVAVTEDETGQVIPSSDTRRSVYLQVRRSKPVSFLQAFDAPIMETNCERRSSSTVAPQALMLLNSDFMRTQAERLAARVQSEAPTAIDPVQIPAIDVAWPTADSIWQFGWMPLTVQQANESHYDADSFSALPHWTGSAWQGGEMLPDANLEWVHLHAMGGHPGTERAAVRRFVVPFDGVWSLSGTLSHGNANGDGVRARVGVARLGLLGTFEVANGEEATGVGPVELKAGEFVDLIVDGRSNVSSDSFQWSVTLSASDSPESAASSLGPRAFESPKGLHGPAAGPVDQRVVLAWRLALLRDPEVEELRAVAQWMHEVVQVDPQASDRAAAIEQAMVSLCQTLLGSNEFLYVE